MNTNISKVRKYIFKEETSHTQLIKCCVFKVSLNNKIKCYVQLKFTIQHHHTSLQNYYQDQTPSIAIFAPSLLEFFSLAVTITKFLYSDILNLSVLLHRSSHFLIKSIQSLFHHSPSRLLPSLGFLRDGSAKGSG